jgi:hypothetical protein
VQRAAQGGVSARRRRQRLRGVGCGGAVRERRDGRAAAAGRQKSAAGGAVERRRAAWTSAGLRGRLRPLPRRAGARRRATGAHRGHSAGRRHGARPCGDDAAFAALKRRAWPTALRCTRDAARAWGAQLRTRAARRAVGVQAAGGGGVARFGRRRDVLFGTESLPRLHAWPPSSLAHAQPACSCLAALPRAALACSARTICA